MALTFMTFLPENLYSGRTAVRRRKTRKIKEETETVNTTETVVSSLTQTSQGYSELGEEQQNHSCVISE